MDVTDILRARMDPAAGLQQMAVVSVLVHGAFVALLVLAPGGWFSQQVQRPRTVMTISLGGGGAGPENGGLTTIGGRAVQTETPPEAPKVRAPVVPPAAKTPVMTIPKPGAKPIRSSATPVKEGPDVARGRTPIPGAETTPGSSVAETGVRGQGFGLSTGGGSGSGSRLDVEDFCCPDYLVLMVSKILSNWNSRVDAVGETIIAFTIQKDGRITNPTTDKSSGYSQLDLNALRALVYTRQLPALPDGFSNPALTVHLNFQYAR